MTKIHIHEPHVFTFTINNLQSKASEFYGRVIPDDSE